MTRDQNQHRGQAYELDVTVSIMLLVLLIAIALHIPISDEIGYPRADPRSVFVRAACLAVNLGLSLGASSLLLSNRPRDDRNGENQ